MLVPAFLYGNYQSVQRQTKSIVRDLCKTEDLAILSNLTLVDFNAVSGLILLENSKARSPQNEQHFYAYVFMHQVYQQLFVKKTISDVMVGRIFRFSMESSWGVVLWLANSLGFSQDMFHKHPETRVAFANAVLNFWGDLQSVGQRFTNSPANKGKDVWQQMTNLKHVLALLGVPLDKLRQPLPGNELSGLIASSGIVLG